MKTLIAVIAGTALMLSAATQAKFIEKDSPNNPTTGNVSVVSDVIDHQGFGYMAQQQSAANAYYPTNPYHVEYEARTASVTTNPDIVDYLRSE